MTSDTTTSPTTGPCARCGATITRYGPTGTPTCPGGCPPDRGPPGPRPGVCDRLEHGDLLRGWGGADTG